MKHYNDMRNDAKNLENAIKEKYTRDGYAVHTCEIYANVDFGSFDIYVELSKPGKDFYKFIRGTYTREQITKMFDLKGG